MNVVECRIFNFLFRNLRNNSARGPSRSMGDTSAPVTDFQYKSVLGIATNCPPTTKYLLTSTKCNGRAAADIVVMWT